MFQCDEAPFSKTWLAQVDVEELERPAQNPDLKITEHLWDFGKISYKTLSEEWRLL